MMKKASIIGCIIASSLNGVFGAVDASCGYAVVAGNAVSLDTCSVAGAGFAYTLSCVDDNTVEGNEYTTEDCSGDPVNTTTSAVGTNGITALECGDGSDSSDVTCTVYYNANIYLTDTCDGDIQGYQSLAFVNGYCYNSNGTNYIIDCDAETVTNYAMEDCSDEGESITFTQFEAATACSDEGGYYQSITLSCDDGTTGDDDDDAGDDDDTMADDDDAGDDDDDDTMADDDDAGDDAGDDDDDDDSSVFKQLPMYLLSSVVMVMVGMYNA